MSAAPGSMGLHVGPGGPQLSPVGRVRAPLSAVGVLSSGSLRFPLELGLPVPPPWRLTPWTGPDSPVALHSVRVPSGRGCVCVRVTRVHMYVCVGINAPSCSLLFPHKERAGVPVAGAQCFRMGQGKAGLGELPLFLGGLSSQPVLCSLSLIPARPARVTLPSQSCWAQPGHP